MQRYSVDMIRLESKVNVADFTEFMNSNKQLMCDDMQYFQSFRHSDYRHLWRIEQLGSMGRFDYALMLQHNMEKPSQFHNLVIEYNPNKCVYEGFLLLLLTKFFGSRSYVKQTDMALDVDVDMDAILFLNTHFEKFQMIKKKGGRGWYFGERGVGQVKVYDKAAELGMTVGVLTRIEKTIKIDRVLRDSYSFDFMGLTYPELYVPDVLDTLLPELDAKDTLMLLGLRQRPDLIGSLSFKTRKKYAALLAQKRIEIEPAEMSKAYIKCLDTIAKQCYGFDTFR